MVEIGKKFDNIGSLEKIEEEPEDIAQSNFNTFQSAADGELREIVEQD